MIRPGQFQSFPLIKIICTADTNEHKIQWYHTEGSTNSTPCCGWSLWGTVQTRQEACEPTYCRFPNNECHLRSWQNNITSMYIGQTGYHTALPTAPCTNTYAHTSTCIRTHAVPLYVIIMIFTHVTYVHTRLYAVYCRGAILLY